jgi:cytochrome c-type biogenesis protein
LLGSLSRASIIRIRGRLLNVGKYGKQLFGFTLVLLGVLIATGTDKSFEAWILNRTPEWLTAVTTRY